jgi:2-oxoglutarate ferredoxin oxidoreductase subunit alpha
MLEAAEILAGRGIHVNLMRVRGFPFASEVGEFVAAHDKVFVVEQNRDAQLRTLLINEEEINPKQLGRVLHYDGSPITARFIAQTIAGQIG